MAIRRRETRKGGGGRAGRKVPVTKTSARATVSGPSRGSPRRGDEDALEQKMSGANALAAAMPFNPNKAGEHGKASLTRSPGPPRNPKAQPLRAAR